MSAASPYAARYEASKAIRHGILIRQPCESCGRDSRYSEAHHEDYARPLDIRWLCRPCHAARHVEIRAIDPTASKRVGFLKNATTTTISLEHDLLRKVQVAAGREGQSVSQWIVGAAKRKMKGELRAAK